MFRRKYQDFINEEVGIRNLKSLIGDHTEFEIWFHKDLDGVTSALAMRYFLETYYNLKIVDCHIIQYGGMEFAVKEGKKGTLKVLVDFAHSKPIFKIATDHHDKQVGADDTKGTYFKPARSNVETISGEISYSDIFTPTDINLIKTIDSADFVKHDLKPEDIQNSIFNFKRELSGEKNRFMMGLVVNRLLLAYKNKRISVKSLDGKREHINRNILECMVLDCSPSLYSMFNNIRHYINTARTADKLGVLAKPEDLMNNLSNYIERMKSYRFIETEDGEAQEYDPKSWRHQQIAKSGTKIPKGVHFDETHKIIMQYGGGALFAPGSYDRYVPFKNFPDANFFCIVWPMGLIQVSCNPFREKKLKDINLGEIAKEVMSKHKNVLNRILIPLDAIKKEFETSQDWKKMQKEEGSDYEGVGFKHSDLIAFYKDCVYKKDDNKWNLKDIDKDDIKKSMDTLYENMSKEDKDLLNLYRIPVWELITRNSGGHPSITNIQGFGFLKYNKYALKAAYENEKYTEVMKKVAREFINALKVKIDASESGQEVIYDTGGVEFTGQDTNENYEYYITNKSGENKKVSIDEFVKSGSKSAMKPENSLIIDNKGKKIIAKFESFKR